MGGEVSKQRKERLEILKARQWPGLKPEEDHGAIKVMEKVLYDSAKASDVDSFVDALQQVSSGKQLTLSANFEQVTPPRNSLLNVAANFGSKEITELVSHHFPNLISRKNFQGDTALHLAARAGKLDTIRILVNNAGPGSESASLLRMGNEKGEAALHDAVINGNYEVVHFLVSVDPVVSETKNEKILALLLEATPGGDSLNGPLGKSPAHAAVEQRNLDILKQIAEKRPELIRVKDEKGRNALHLASLIGYLKGVQCLLEKFSDGAFESDKEGLYPIHVASKNGHVRVINELVDQWFDPKEFLTKKSKNILHVAAEKDQQNVVRYILRNLELASLLNEKDEDGNTPLHLATKLNDIANNENLTSFDVAQGQSRKAEAEYFESTISNEKPFPVQNKLTNSKPVNHGRTQPQAVDSKESKQPDYFGLAYEFLPIQGKPLSKEEMKSRVETLLVVAVLVASVTFAGAMVDAGPNVHRAE
ncbi:unnamed protein product [Dovyalis caffra]|uniref:PGG domain-containing protein n=1 Tax=Dovyalis caffra TaxID=77055 RepID=A0AAV1SFJ5_9ROSI|nr:unnamed protein product [Dovyalis caffra]